MITVSNEISSTICAILRDLCQIDEQFNINLTTLKTQQGSRLELNPETKEYEPTGKTYDFVQNQIWRTGNRLTDNLNFRLEDVPNNQRDNWEWLLPIAKANADIVISNMILRFKYYETEEITANNKIFTHKKIVISPRMILPKVTEWEVVTAPQSN